MLDLNYIRENPEKVAEGAGKKGIEINISEITELEKHYREISSRVQSLQAERNNAARERDIEKGREIKAKLEEIEIEANQISAELKSKILSIPNLPFDEVPEGGEDDFQILEEPDASPMLSFTPKDHVELGKLLNIIDIERATKVSGARFVYLKNEGVLLELALVQFALQKLMAHGFEPVFPPALIKRSITKGLGYWTQGNHNNYYLVSDYEEIEEGKETGNPLYLIGTAEHALVPMYKDEILNGKNLPIRYAGFSPSFRREAGSYGRDTRGILRMHQFDKVEMVSFAKAENDGEERKLLLKIAKELLGELGLKYRVVRLASRDISFPAAETIDIETWIPSQNKYRETHSISTTTDFQARRLNIKYQEGNEKKFVHILNGTAFAIGRTIIAILENYQQEDGSVVIPEVLRKYMNGREKILPK